jgi:hypothetical protein
MKSAAVRVVAGETMDFAFAPSHPGDYVLEVTSTYNVPRVTRAPVIARVCDARRGRVARSRTLLPSAAQR